MSTYETLAKARAEFERLVSEIRPELHRYCARMTGSVVDGEDVVQDTLAKAFYLLPQTAQIENLRGWIFRIAHNKAIDYIRAHSRRYSDSLTDYDTLAAEETPMDRAELTKISLALFMQLTPPQRASVILKDVLDHSLNEVAEITGLTVAAVKGALHRGRANLRRLAPPAATPPPLALENRTLLENYVKHFVSQDFDKLRELLAQDVRLDVVGITQSRGAAEVGNYFHRYQGLSDWRPRIGTVEGRPAILIFNAAHAEAGYFILIDWEDQQVTSIRDFRYARYVMNDAVVNPL